MKIIHFLTCMLAINFNGWSQRIDKAPIVMYVDRDSISDCHLLESCYELFIKRESITQTVIVLFPLSGTTSYIMLYDEKDYILRKDSPEELVFARLKQDGKSATDNQPLTLNMTWMKDGDYIEVYQACGLAGTIKIHLVTK